MVKSKLCTGDCRKNTIDVLKIDLQDVFNICDTADSGCPYCVFYLFKLIGEKYNLSKEEVFKYIDNIPKGHKFTQEAIKIFYG